MIKNVKSLVRVKKNSNWDSYKKIDLEQDQYDKKCKKSCSSKKNSNWDNYKKIDLEQDQHEKR